MSEPDRASRALLWAIVDAAEAVLLLVDLPLRAVGKIARLTHLNRMPGEPFKQCLGASEFLGDVAGDIGAVRVYMSAE